MHIDAFRRAIRKVEQMGHNEVPPTPSADGSIEKFCLTWLFRADAVPGIIHSSTKSTAALMTSRFTSHSSRYAT